MTTQWTMPKCPKGDWHTVDLFWFSEDPVKPAPPPRGVMCLTCDDVVVTFDDEAAERYRIRMAALGRTDSKGKNDE